MDFVVNASFALKQGKFGLRVLLKAFKISVLF